MSLTSVALALGCFLITLILLLFFFWDKVLVCNWGWHWTHDLPASAHLVLGSQAGIFMPWSIMVIYETKIIISSLPTVIRVTSDSVLERLFKAMKHNLIWRLNIISQSLCMVLCCSKYSFKEWPEVQLETLRTNGRRINRPLDGSIHPKQHLLSVHGTQVLSISWRCHNAQDPGLLHYQKEQEDALTPHPHTCPVPQRVRHRVSEEWRPVIL